MSSQLLTIAIPTFNRSRELRTLLQQLLPQLTDRVSLVIHDNCSDLPVADQVSDLLSAYKHNQTQVRRNAVNVGANANILRCFEQCETEWLWVVGDDDEVEPCAVETILNRIVDCSDFLVINFPIDKAREVNKVTVGLTEFADCVDKSADIPWITSTVYRVSEILPNIRFGYQFAFSMLPHVAMLMMSFKSDHQCFFATDHISNRDRVNADTSQQTPIINMALGYGVLLDLPIPLSDRRKLVSKLLITSDSAGLPLLQLTYQLILLSLKSGDSKSSRYYFKQACSRRFYFDKSFTQRLEIFLYSGLLLIPASIINKGYKLLKHREMGDQVHQDRLTRL